MKEKKKVYIQRDGTQKWKQLNFLQTTLSCEKRENSGYHVAQNLNIYYFVPFR